MIALMAPSDIVIALIEQIDGSIDGIEWLRL